MAAAAPAIKLKSSDGEVMEVDMRIVMQFGTIKTMIEDLGMVEEDEEPIPLPKVNAKILRKVIEWANHHKDDVPPTGEQPNPDTIDAWDLEFLGTEVKDLNQILLAANFLDIKGLYTTCCKKVASLLKGRSPAEIREMFMIQNDFEPEEEARIRQENNWRGDN